MESETRKKLQIIPENLSNYGYCIIDNLIDCNSFSKLTAHFNKNIHQLKSAAVGQKSSKVVNENLRSDMIYWVDDAAEELVTYFEIVESIKCLLKQECYLPIKSTETQMAQYNIGSFYTRHKDRHFKSEHRWVTLAFYLNSEWQTSDAGELIIYAKNEDGDSKIKVQPIGNRMVIFLSELEHEVLMTQLVRKSFTTWFRDDF